MREKREKEYEREDRTVVGLANWREEERMKKERRKGEKKRRGKWKSSEGRS